MVEVVEEAIDIYSLIGAKALKKKGIIKERVVTEEVELHYHLSEYPCFGILFSAHWCPPCKGLLLNLKNLCSHVNS